jgi:hypothetical protein
MQLISILPRDSPDPDSYRDYRDARERGEHKFITINYYCLLP